MSSGPHTRARAGGSSSYRVLHRLGSGGMAHVELVLQTTPAGVERLAVMKRARAELSGQPELDAMFWEEARIAAALSHQNVVQTYEVGQDAAGYFLVLEFLRGQSYAEVLSRAGYTDYRFSVEVLLGTLQGLEYAHALQQMAGGALSLVHRDISPPNVFVTYDGQIKVLDFGIAKARGSLIRTESGVVKGKAAYMAPEQMRGEPCDLRADLYAVGVMLWEATAGYQRFAHLPDLEISSQIAAEHAVQPPGAASRGLPELADEICARALAPNPAHRYGSAGEFHDQLLLLAQQLGGRLATRAVGQQVSLLFAKEQAEQQARIESALSAQGAAVEQPVLAPELAAGGSGTRPLRIESDRIHAQPLSATPLPAVEPPAAQAAMSLAPLSAQGAGFSLPRKARPLLIAGLCALVVVGMKVGACLSSRGETAALVTSNSVTQHATPSAPPPLVIAPAMSATAADSAAARASPNAATNSSKPKASWLNKRSPQLAAPLDQKTTDAFGGRR